MKSKKIFVLLSALALSLAACNGGTTGKSSQAGGESRPSDTSASTVPTSDPTGSSEPGEQTIAVTGITLSETALSLEEGKSANLTATVAPANASNTKVSWESSDAEVASVSSLGKVTAKKVGTAKITVKSVSNPEVKAECTVTVTEEGGKYGSVNKPKTVAEILAIAAEECKETNDKTAEPVYVKGIVHKAPTNKDGFSQGIYLKDKLSDEKDLWVYSANHEATKVPYQNDELILHGYLMNHNGTIEISNVTIGTEKIYPEIDVVTRGTSSISYSAEHGSFNAEAPTSGKNLSEFSFSVVPAEGYKVDNVTVNGDEVAPQADGSYKATVKGETKVVANISEEGVEMLSATMEYKGTETINMDVGNNATLVSLDASLFEVTSDNPTGPYVGLNAAGNFRLYNGYKNEADKTLGTTLTVSSRRAIVKKITVTLASTTVAGFDDMQVKAGDAVVTGSEGVYEIENGTFSIKNAANADASKQLHISKIAIAYVLKEEIHATGISLNETSIELEAGKHTILTATLDPSNATDAITWSSTDEAIATVDQAGKVTAVAEGMAVINAKVSDTIMARCQVTVKPAKVLNYGTAEAPLTIAQAKAVLDETGSNISKQPLFVKGIVSTSEYSTKYKNYTIWLQSDDGSVEKDFELYATILGEGVTGDYTAADALKGMEVVATGYGKIYSPTYELTNTKVDDVTVYPTILSVKAPAATGVALDKETLSLTVGGEATLVATLSPAGSTGTVVWSSSDEAVATVVDGKVTAVAAGTATISAVIGNGVVASCVVTVSAASIAATGVELNATSGSLFVGGSVTLTATVSPSDSTDTVVWSSSDETVATVDNGKVTAVGAGSATITATAGSAKAEYALTVTVEHGSVITDPLTVEEALTMGAALAGGAKTEREYYIKGIVYQIDDNSLKASYNNATFWLYAGEGVKGFEGYRMKPTTDVPAADYDNFKVGAEVVIVCKITNYVKNDVSTIENSGGNIVSITAKTTDATAVALDKESLELEAGETGLLKATLTPSYATSAITWESSDEAVATVNNGTVTAVAAGTATITAKVSDTVKATCTVTVTASSGTETTYQSVAKYNFVSADATNTRSIDATVASSIFNKVSGSDLFNSVTAVTNVYEAANGGSGDTAWKTSNVLKIGKSKAAGSITFKLNSEVSKLALKGGAVTATASITVNGHSVATAFKDNLVNKSAIGEDGYLSNPGLLEFEFDATDTITIEIGNSNSNANFGVLFTEMEFFAVAGDPTPVGNPLPLAADKTSKVEGAGYWIYLDNTSLGITGENAAAIIASANITITVEEGNSPEESKAAIEGFLASAGKTQAETLGDVKQFDSYEAGSVRLYFTVQAGIDPSWQIKQTVNISLTINEVTYSSTLVFIGGVLQA